MTTGDVPTSTTANREPTTVLLPTVEWTPACDDLAGQLRPGDELLVICDSESDPVAGTDPPERVDVLVAGEPEGCSGKANAMAHGMERAENDRFVWTDADFRREDDWLDRLVAEGETHGPATAIPFFYGGGWWLLWEPWTVLFSTFLFYLGVGSWGGNAWGGGVTFTRDDLNVDALTTELRHALSDDGLLSQHLGETHPIRSMVVPVEVPGGFRSVIERQTRFTRLTHVREGMYDAVVIGAGLLGAAIVFPLGTAALVTGVAAVAYALLGVRRWTFVLAFPGVVTVPLGGLLGIFRAEFEWAGRRYRLDGPRDVEVVD